MSSERLMYIQLASCVQKVALKSPKNGIFFYDTKPLFPASDNIIRQLNLSTLIKATLVVSAVIRTSPPRLGLGFRSRSGLVLGLGGNQTIPPEENRPRLGLRFGLGLVLGLGGNFPRGKLS